MLICATVDGKGYLVGVDIGLLGFMCKVDLCLGICLKVKASMSVMTSKLPTSFPRLNNRLW
jgi:hypothetical protein